MTIPGRFYSYSLLAVVIGYVVLLVALSESRSSKPLDTGLSPAEASQADVPSERIPQIANEQAVHSPGVKGGDDAHAHCGQDAGGIWSCQVTNLTSSSTGKSCSGTAKINRKGRLLSIRLDC